MRYLRLLVVVVVVSGCANNGHTGHWPASVVSVQGFSADQEKTLREALSEMNENANQIVFQDIPSDNSYPVTIILRDPWPDAPTRAGLTTMDSTQCTTQLSNIIFDPTKTDYLKPVVWHEMGHCAGLVHVPDQTQIMYFQSEPYSFYSNNAISEFYQSFLQSAGL